MYLTGPFIAFIDCLVVRTLDVVTAPSHGKVHSLRMRARQAMCTAADTTVQGVPSTLKCLEAYVQASTTTCPLLSQKTLNVPREIFPNCPDRENYTPKTVNVTKPVCCTCVALCMLTA